MSGVLPRNGVWVLPSNIGWSGVLPSNRGGLGLEGGVSGVLPRNGVWVLPSNIGWSGVNSGIRGKGCLGFFQGMGSGFYQGI